MSTSFSPMNVNNLSNNNNNKPLKIFDVDNNINENSLFKNIDVRRTNKNELYRSMKKLANSQTFDNIYGKNTNWKQDIKDYEKEKKFLKWGRNPPVRYYTKLYINSEDRLFDPITQKYLDKSKEEKFKNKEKTDIINNISKGYDNSVNISQSYDIINLQDKLKGLENEENYPNSPKIKRKKFYSLTPKINYNIISNLNYKIHHYDKPENRPNIRLIKNNHNGFFYHKGNNRKKIIITRSLKDFNIISNDYYEYNKDKKKLDEEISNLNIANKFYKMQKLNPLTGIYYDEEKEKGFQDKKELKMKKLLTKKNEVLFSPFNFKVLNEEKLKQKDLLDMNKIARYKLRNQLDNYYRLKNESFDEKYLNILKHKLSYNRYKQADERCYDILSNQEILNLKKDEKDSNDKTPWKLIKEGSNEHETITKSQHLIVRDKEDIFRKYAYNKLKREKIIKNLPRLDSEPLFQIKKNKRKSNIEFNSPKIIKSNSFILGKEAWFNTKISNEGKK